MKVYYIKHGFEAIGSLSLDRITQEYPYHKVHVEDITTFKGLLRWGN